jgi:hypothetical protein
MALPLYLALTAGEFQNCSPLPEHTAWMACHYSPYGLGLSNSPRQLPEGAMLILNDRTPAQGHDPALIASQTEECARRFRCSRILLDFQRTDSVENLAVARAVLSAASCPVGVSDIYAKELDCPVFLPPVPPHTALDNYLAPWRGREIWLEAALAGETATVTEQGSIFSSLSPPPPADISLTDPTLHCHYQIETGNDYIAFKLWRTREDLDLLLEEGEKHGITAAIGLWQELN